MATGLLLVAALHVGLAADGLAVRNFRCFQRHVHSVTFLKPADDDLDVLLPATAKQELLGLWIAIKAQRLVLFQNAVDCIAHPVLIWP